MFSGGCRNLRIYTGEDNLEPSLPLVPSPEALTAIRTFVVVNTQGLRELELYSLPYSHCRDFTLELCRACPQLKTFTASWIAADGVTSADIDSFAAELSRTCPLGRGVLRGGAGGGVRGGVRG